MEGGNASAPFRVHGSRERATSLEEVKPETCGVVSCIGQWLPPTLPIFATLTQVAAALRSSILEWRLFRRGREFVEFILGCGVLTEEARGKLMALRRLASPAEAVALLVIEGGSDLALLFKFCAWSSLGFADEPAWSDPRLLDLVFQHHRGRIVQAAGSDKETDAIGPMDEDAGL